VGEWGEREGGRGKEGRQGRIFSRVKTFEGLFPRHLTNRYLGRRERDVNSISCKFRELLIPVQR